MPSGEAAIFDQLRALFEQQVAHEPDKRQSGPHAQMFLQVVNVAFAATPQELCERVPKVIDAILLEINKRPRIMLERPEGDWQLAPWFVLRLLLALVGLEDISARAKVEEVLLEILQTSWTVLLPFDGQPLALELSQALLRVLQGLSGSAPVKVFQQRDSSLIGPEDLNLLDLAPPQALALQASLAKVLVQALSSHSPASFRAQLSSQAPAVINTAFEVVAQTSVSMAAKLPIVHGLLQCAPAQAAKAVDALLDLFLNRLQRPIPIEAPDSDLLACTVQLKMLPRHVAGPAIAQRMSGPLKDLIGQSIGSNAGQTGGSTTLQSAILNLLLLPLSETFVLSMLPSEQQQHVKAVFATEVEATCPPSHSKKRKRDSIQLPTQAVSRIASHWKGLVQTAIEGTGVEDWATNESLESLVNRLADRLLSRADQPGQQQIVSALLRIPCARNETLKASSREDQAVACTWCDLDQPSMSRVMNDACLKTLLAICPKMLAPSRSMLMHASAFRLLTRFINHVRPGVEAIKLLPPPSVNHIMELIMPHLGSRDRSVRLASGACLVALACAHHSAPIWKDCHMDPALKRLETYANPDHGNKPPLRETALLTLAKLGRYVPDPERFVVLRALTMQLGRQSEPLAAVAYLQVLALARALSTTASRLYAPSMPALLAHIYERHSYGQRSNIIVSALSDLTGIEPSVFIKQNVPHILPAFLLQQRQDALQYLEATAGANVRELCIEHAGPVLASLYLRNPHQTRQGVAWMTDLIGSGIRDIYLTCGQKLLFDLVVELGEESEPRRLVAIDAIKRLDRDVHAGTVVYTVDVQRLLGEHMLAILSQMNEALNDTFVKQNLHYKAKVLRSLALVITEVGTSLSRVTPQVMATLQSSLNMPGLELATLEAWEAFVRSMNFADLAPFIGQTSAAFASMWTHFHEAERTLARKILEFLIVDNVREMGAHVNEMANLSSLHGLQNIQARVNTEHKEASIETRLRYMLTRVGSENQSVCLQGLKDLKTVIETDYTESIAKFVKGNLFDPIIGRTVKTVIGAAHRAGDAWDNVRDTAFEVLGLLGAVDPDRCEMPPADSGFVLHRNFEEPHETIDFVVHLISSILASSYQASNDTRHQSTLAFAIQELLKFCGFTKDVLDKRNQALPTKIRTKWALFSDSVVDIVAPLLDSRYAAQSGLPARAPSRPLYKTVSSFRDWIKAWTLDLIAHVENSQAKKIFDTFVSIIRLGDLAVARRVLPHVALHLVISSKPHKHATTAADNIRHEIISVLSDQVDSRSAYSANARLLCAQVVFDVMDHLSKWTRTRGSEIARKKLQLKKLGKVQPAEMAALTKPMTMVQATLSNVPQHLQAQAALKCKALARSLMNFEMLLTSLSDKSPDSRVEYYDAMHQIYAELDEPDGMEGISVKILHPSLRHQIREHEVLGKWTAAQSCWELQLQQEPRNVASHIGLLTCLRNLGHYDSMRTHVTGLLATESTWRPLLAPFEVEGAFIAGDYAAVESVLALPDLPFSPEITFARVLNVLRVPDISASLKDKVLTQARSELGTEIAAAGQESYRRVYDAVLRLHILHELDLIHRKGRQHNSGSVTDLHQRLAERIESISPAFRNQELLLAMRRAAFRISPNDPTKAFQGLWLSTAKIARKAGHRSTAYSAILQAESLSAPFAFMESAKLMKANSDGRPDQALKIIENHLDTGGKAKLAASPLALSKIVLKRARWMVELERYAHKAIMMQFNEARQLAKEVSAPHFYLGRYCDDLFKAAFDTDGFAGGPAQEYANQMIRHYTESLKHGAKFIYQAMPRLLTVYMEMGDSDPEVIKLGSTSKRIRHEAITTPPVQQVDRLLKQIGKHLRDSLEALPHWQWLVSLQQLVSRIAHANDSVFAFIELVLLKLLAFFPHPTFWAMVPVRNSAHSQRKNRCDTIFTKLPTDPETLLEAGKERIADAHKISRKGFRLVEQLLYMANYEPQSKDKEKDKESILKIDQHFPNLIKCMPCPLQIPLQSSLTVTLPAVTSESSGASNTKHRPFPKYLPTFKELENDVEIMSSLIRPKKFTCKSNLGQTYSFLCKPQDDLRKDARLMEFNSVINKLLKKDSESRKRGLHIRTYAVVPINEACGLIQWVSNTIGLRHILSRLYEARGLGTYPAEVRQIYEHIRDDPNESANIFNTKVLPMFPPIFHEWFLEMFPEPSTWFTNRQAYARTTAVMSMVGFVLGLGDRHGENILYDATCGDTVHVDFNCLFDKGRTFEVSEKVPFRLTQNIVDGFGVMGVEGVFRRSAEVTMKILRANHEALMSVMESFVHDPLLEWSVKKSTKSKKGHADSSQDREAQRALKPIRRKLLGLQSTAAGSGSIGVSTVENQVESLIREAMDPVNLSQMYVGWASYL